MCMGKWGGKVPTLHNGADMGVLGCAGSKGAGQGADTVLTSMVLVGHLSQWYKWPTCPKGANLTRTEHIEAAASALLICSALFLLLSL